MKEIYINLKEVLEKKKLELSMGSILMSRKRERNKYYKLKAMKICASCHKRKVYKDTTKCYRCKINEKKYRVKIKKIKSNNFIF